MKNQQLSIFIKFGIQKIIFYVKDFNLQGEYYIKYKLS